MEKADRIHAAVVWCRQHDLHIDVPSGRSSVAVRLLGVT